MHGIKNVVDAVSRQADRLPALHSVLMVSTDKACAPTNVYGMCKALAERLVTSQCLALERPRFIGVRYGNVLQSRGSIIPLFRWQASNSGSFTVTHPEMTRFVMTLDESIDLIIATVKTRSRAKYGSRSFGLCGSSTSRRFSPTATESPSS